MEARLFLTFLTILLLMPAPAVGQPETGEIIAYRTSVSRTTFFGYYNTHTKAHRRIMAGDFFPEYSLSSSGRLAYTVDANGDLDIYVLDTHASDVPPINLSNLSESADRPLAWSPDGQMLALESVDATGNASLVIWNGKSNITIPLTKEAITFQRIDADWSPNGRYLMIRAQVDADTELAYIWDGATIQPLLPFGIDDSVRLQNYRREWSPDSTQLSFIVSFPDGSNRLYVWDGSETIDIMPPLFARDSTVYNHLAWSQDGRLAFAVAKQAETTQEYRGEIYIWDGYSSINLSQQVDLHDSYPVWSMDGKIAFLSAEWVQGPDYSYLIPRILVWDGTSYAGTLPDRNTFQVVGPDLSPTALRWLEDGRLMFSAAPPGQDSIQGLAWDGEQVENLTSNPDFHNSLPRWSETGLWAFSTFFSRAALLYVRDRNNHTLLMTRSHNFTWLRGDDLMLCRTNLQGSGRPYWNLAHWDGNRITSIVDGGEISAVTSSGQQITCSSG
ncbi:MAG TPA: WD40 repeat domain-containing protein [Aggregatilineales bacterium]|nr:WD40 repeat domain-containing protein [Aggregatilineales bacterium]